MKSGLLLIFGAVLVFGGEYYYMNGDKRVELEPISSLAAKYSVSGSALYFKKGDGKEIAVPNRVILKLDSPENLDSYLRKYNLKLVKKFDFGNMYLLEAQTPELALEAANALYEEKDVVLAQPDIIRSWRLR